MLKCKKCDNEQLFRDGSKHPHAYDSVHDQFLEFVMNKFTVIYLVDSDKLSITCNICNFNWTEDTKDKE